MFFVDFVNIVNYNYLMNNENNKKTQENQASNSHQDTNDKRNKSGIYLRDDHCDWGSSGMNEFTNCLLYTSPSPRDKTVSRMPSSA